MRSHGSQKHMPISNTSWDAEVDQKNKLRRITLDLVPIPYLLLITLDYNRYCTRYYLPSRSLSFPTHCEGSLTILTSNTSANSLHKSARNWSALGRDGVCACTLVTARSARPHCTMCVNEVMSGNTLRQMPAYGGRGCEDGTMWLHHQYPHTYTHSLTLAHTHTHTHTYTMKSDPLLHSHA